MTAERPVVTFSAGNPPVEDLIQRGLGLAHLDDGVIRVARSVLRKSLDAAYAGDLRGAGFTTSLADDTGKVVVGPRFISFLGWPFSESLTTSKIADTLGLCRYVRIDPEVNVKNPKPSSESPEFRWAMAQATTATRKLLFSGLRCNDINSEAVAPRVARILFAGKARKFLGVMPGIAEEAMCALRANLAVYIVGAFGGAARLLADAITTSGIPPEFCIDSHRSDPIFSTMLEGAKESERSESPETMFRELQATLEWVREDLDRLHNGLNKKENYDLMQTSDLGRVVRLISKGLNNLGYV